LGGGISGTGVVLVWRNRQVIRAAEDTGETFRAKYEKLKEMHSEIADRVKPVTDLHLECVIAIIDAVLRLHLKKQLDEQAKCSIETELITGTEPPIANLRQVPMFLETLTKR
jgi:hypothetical protein